MATSSAVTSANNLDVNSIVSQLMQVERQPLAKLDRMEASYQAKLSAFGVLKGAVSSFASAVRSLNSATKFQALSATSSNTESFTAFASSIAAAGSYTLEVNSLAKSQKLIAGGLASSTAAIGTGTLTFNFGTIAGNTFNSGTGKYGATLSGAVTVNGSASVTVASTANLAVGAAISGVGIPAGATIASIDDATHFTLSAAATADGTVDLQAAATFTSNGSSTRNITIDSSNNTLEGIRDAINAANMGVTATIINDGSATPYRLSLASDSTGVANSVKIGVSGDAALETLLAHNPAGTQNLSETVSASNASLKVNGVAVSKTSNTVPDVVQGVTLTLLKETTTPATLTVARDTAGISASVGSFVDAYNKLANVLKEMSSYDANTQRAAILQGDFTVRTLQSKLRGILGSSVTTSPGGLTTLSGIGVAFQKDGSLALDQTKLDAAIKDNFSDLATLFSSENGYLTKLDFWTSSVLASGGALANRTEGISNSIKDIDRRRTEMEYRLVTIEKRYRTQFTALDMMLTSMNNTSTYLSQQLAQLSKLNG